MSEYLSRTKGKPEDGLVEYVVTNGGKYYCPIMMRIENDYVVAVYECSEYGHIHFENCTYIAHWDDEYEARHDIMACFYYMEENGIPNHELQDAPRKDEYSDEEDEDEDDCCGYCMYCDKEDCSGMEGLKTGGLFMHEGYWVSDVMDV